MGGRRVHNVLKSILRIFVSSALLLTALASFHASAEAPAQVTSPDGDIVVTVSDTNGRANYTISYEGEAVVGSSRLGLIFKDRYGFDRNLAISSVEMRAHDETWEQPWGERRFVRDHHNEMLVSFVSTAGPDRHMNVRFRVFDDGVGFRYEIPKQRHLGKINIIDELTEFAVAEQSTAWWIPAHGWNRYEYTYETSAASDVSSAHTPITFRTPEGVHLSVHEAALVDYSGMSLKQYRPGRFKADLAPWSGGVLVKTKTSFTTPWRTIQIAPDAVGLVNSDLILNLNEPNKLGDVSWIEPGKYVGIWWAMHMRDRSWGNDTIHGATTQETKRYIDFAAKYGFMGVLVEGWNIGWDGDWFNHGDLFKFTDAYPDFDLPALGAYAQEKGVRLIGHHETSGDVTNYENQLSDALDLYQSAGVRAVKTGYVADGGGIERIDKNGIKKYEWHDGQFMVDHHLRVVKEAAKRKIAINPHEPIKDTGLRRTYPNWISREGARGQEYNAWGQPPNSPEHTAILPFTRMLSGPMDFTPGIFDLEPNKRPPLREDMPRGDPVSRVQTTLAKQLALYVVLYSPIQMAADLPENYEQNLEAFQFIIDVPTDWEDSIALSGEVGDHVVFARKDRNSDDWYIGAVTDEEARRLSVPLSFLDEGRAYVAQLYRDGAKADWDLRPYDMIIEERAVTSETILDLPLAPGGGAAVRFFPAAQNDGQ
jgi:alpha-glucosidase